MTQEEINLTLMKIQGVLIETFLNDDTGNTGLNPTIIIQVVDDEFEYGYWDYLYKTNANNPNWYNEFKKALDDYLIEYGCEVIQSINMYVVYFESMSDAEPYGYWDCLNNYYQYQY